MAKHYIPFPTERVQELTKCKTCERYVTRKGEVCRWYKSKDNFSSLKPSVTQDGYLYVSTGAKSMEYVHRLVYITYNGDIPEGYEIDHINNKRDDNRLENLQLVTHVENMRKPETRENLSNAMKKRHHIVIP